MKKRRLIGLIALLAGIVFVGVYCFILDMPLLRKVVCIEEGKQPTIVLLRAFPYQEFIYCISILITGHIDGKAIIHQSFKGIRGHTYGVVEGDVCLEITGDWYQPEYWVEYEPINVNSGSLKIRYLFNSNWYENRGSPYSRDSVYELWRAAKEGNLDKVKTTVAEEPKLVNAYIFGFSLLHIASSKGHKRVVDFLITSGADVNAKGSNDLTPLFLAVERWHKDVVELLIISGANVNDRTMYPMYTGQTQTPLDVAISNGYQEIAELLRKYGGLETIDDQK